jgi:hypothetical protein
VERGSGGCVSSLDSPYVQCMPHALYRRPILPTLPRISPPSAQRVCTECAGLRRTYRANSGWGFPRGGDEIRTESLSIR